MQFLHSHRAFIKATVNGSGDSEGTSDDRTDAGQEAGKSLRAFFAVDNFHGGDVLKKRTGLRIGLLEDGFAEDIRGYFFLGMGKGKREQGIIRN